MGGLQVEKKRDKSKGEQLDRRRFVFIMVSNR